MKRISIWMHPRNIVLPFLGLSVLLTACSSYTQLRDQERWKERHLEVIAEDLVAAAESWFDVHKAVHVDRGGYLSDSLELAFRRRGYAMSPVEVGDAVRVSHQVWPVAQSEELQAGVIVDGKWRVDRLYRISTDRIEAMSAYAISAARPMQGTGTEIQPNRWVLAVREVSQNPDNPPTEAPVADREIASVSEEPEVRETTPPDPQPETAPESDPDAFEPEPLNLDESNEYEPEAIKKSTCSEFRLEVGSLQRNVKRIVQACGWHVHHWASDPDNSRQEVDWIVGEPMDLDVASMVEFLEILRKRYGLDFSINHGRKYLEFEYAPD